MLAVISPFAFLAGQDLFATVNTLLMLSKRMIQRYAFAALAAAVLIVGAALLERFRWLHNKLRCKSGCQCVLRLSFRYKRE